MLDEDAKYIAKEYYGLSSFNPIKANMCCLSVLRNICAHGGRIYGRRLPFRINLLKADRKHFKVDHNDTYFSTLFAMKYLCPSATVWKQFIIDIWQLLYRYKEYIDPILLDLRDTWFEDLLKSGII
jgi:abortive infection bacteriophage resistance protein